MHKVNREGDEYACMCGLRWGVDEDDPHHSEPKVYQYKVVAEHYHNRKFIEMREFTIDAVHCSVAAREIEMFEGFEVVSAERL